MKFGAAMSKVLQIVSLALFCAAVRAGSSGTSYGEHMGLHCVIREKP